MDLDLDEPEWMADAACAGSDPERFTSPFGPRAIHDTKMVCARCMVQANCLEYALAVDDQFGVWGGMTYGERRKLRGERALLGL